MDDTTSGTEFILISEAHKLSIYDGTDNATRLLIDTSGNVSIGHDAPAAKMHIVTSSYDIIAWTLGYGQSDTAFIK